MSVRAAREAKLQATLPSARHPPTRLASPTAVVYLHAVVDAPTRLAGTTSDFWAGALGWPAGDPWPGHPELRSLQPPQGRAYVHLQQIHGPPRVHLDLECDRPGSTVARAVGAGAVVVAAEDRWCTLRSPGGLPFCVLRARAHPAPQPVTWADGHRSRLVQVCIDAPQSRHDDEVAFWRGLLGGRWVDSRSAEFAGTWHDDAGSPLQLLFQRLDEPDGLVRAHLDLGTDDRDAEVARLLRLGAEDVGEGHDGWHALRDPAGLAFCVTGNAPDQRRRRDLGRPTGTRE